MGNARRPLIACLVVFGILFIGLAIWLTERIQAVDPQVIQDFLIRARDSGWSLPMVCLIYVVGGFILFPVTVLSLMTAAVFGSVLGPLYGLFGCLASALTMFPIGHLIGKKGLRRLIGDKIKKVDDRFRDAGVVGIAILRLIPIAPYSVVNLAAGFSSVRFVDYVLGTILGLLPALIVKGIVGDALSQVLIDPTPAVIRTLALGSVLWMILAYASYLLAKKWQRRQEGLTHA